MSFETPPEWNGSPSGRIDDGLEGTWRSWQSYRWSQGKRGTRCPASPTDVRIPAVQGLRVLKSAVEGAQRSDQAPSAGISPPSDSISSSAAINASMSPVSTSRISAPSRAPPKRGVLPPAAGAAPPPRWRTRPAPDVEDHRHRARRPHPTEGGGHSSTLLVLDLDLEREPRGTPLVNQHRERLSIIWDLPVCGGQGVGAQKCEPDGFPVGWNGSANPAIHPNTPTVSRRSPTSVRRRAQ